MGTALPTLVMIPGTLCDGRLFERQKRALRGVADVVLVDYGRLADRRSWAPELLKTLPPIFSLAGFSLGGLWAQELLRLAPQRIDRLAMIASNAQGASARGRRKNVGLWRDWRSTGVQRLAHGLLPAYFHHGRARGRHTPHVLAMARSTPRKAARAEFDWAGSRPDGFEALRHFNGPLLIVSGAKDRVCPPAWQKAMVDAQPRARWLELPRVGHFVPFEAGAQLNRALLHWMRS